MRVQPHPQNAVLPLQMNRFILVCVIVEGNRFHGFLLLSVNREDLRLKDLAEIKRQTTANEFACSGDCRSPGIARQK